MNLHYGQDPGPNSLRAVSDRRLHVQILKVELLKSRAGNPSYKNLIWRLNSLFLSTAAAVLKALSEVLIDVRGIHAS